MAICFSGCATPKGETRAEQRMHIERERQATLAELHAKEPQTKGILAQAAGYGVFSNIGTQIIWGGSHHGYGVVVNRKSGEHTYMRMAGLKGGLGLGIRAFRAVMVFHDPVTLHRFITEGWEFGIGADAAVSSKDEGIALAGAGTATEGISIYQLTDEGLKVGVALSGTKFWQDDTLNR